MQGCTSPWRTRRRIKTFAWTQASSKAIGQGDPREQSIHQGNPGEQPTHQGNPGEQPVQPSSTKHSKSKSSLHRRYCSTRLKPGNSKIRQTLLSYPYCLYYVLNLHSYVINVYVEWYLLEATSNSVHSFPWLGELLDSKSFIESRRLWTCALSVSAPDITPFIAHILLIKFVLYTWGGKAFSVSVRQKLTLSQLVWLLINLLLRQSNKTCLLSSIQSRLEVTSCKLHMLYPEVLKRQSHLLGRHRAEAVGVAIKFCGSSEDATFINFNQWSQADQPKESVISNGQKVSKL